MAVTIASLTAEITAIKAELQTPLAQLDTLQADLNAFAAAQTPPPVQAKLVYQIGDTLVLGGLRRVLDLKQALAATSARSWPSARPGGLVDMENNTVWYAGYTQGLRAPYKTTGGTDCSFAAINPGTERAAFPNGDAMRDLNIRDILTVTSEGLVFKPRLQTSAEHAACLASVQDASYTWLGAAISSTGYRLKPPFVIGMKARMPLDTKGAWPALWLLPGDQSWPPEFDILEMFGGGWGSAGDNFNQYITAMHWGSSGYAPSPAPDYSVAGSASYTLRNVFQNGPDHLGFDPAVGFHDYALMVTGSQAFLFVDGMCRWVWTTLPADVIATGANQGWYALLDYSVASWVTGTSMPAMTVADVYAYRI